jgi:hypothetical protein
MTNTEIADLVIAFLLGASIVLPLFWIATRSKDKGK